MNKPNITEGEWELIIRERTGKSGKHIKRVHQIRRKGDDSDAGKITTWNGIAKSGSSKGHANAKAISAIPDMIDALIGLVHLIGSDDEYEYKGSHVGQIKYDEAVNALKKAGVNFNGEDDE